MIEIKNMYTKEIICRGETIQDAINEAMDHDKSLFGADFRGANIHETQLGPPRMSALAVADLLNTPPPMWSLMDQGTFND